MNIQTLWEIVKGFGGTIIAILSLIATALIFAVGVYAMWKHG